MNASEARKGLADVLLYYLHFKNRNNSAKDQCYLRY